jgi:hypothetical protein
VRRRRTKEAALDEICRQAETETAMTGRPTELVGMGYLTDAKAYLKAGNALSQSDIELYSPVYFLLCHAIELSLKAFILASGGSERELKQQDTRHHLNVLRDRARALGYQSANEKTDEVIEMLVPYHSNHSFRYRDPGYASFPIIADTIEVLTSMLDEISPLVWRKVRSMTPTTPLSGI